MQSDFSTRLLHALIAERDGLRGFVALLEQEQSALIENLGDPLLELAEQKSARALSLSKLVETRLELLNEHLPALTPPFIQTWLEAHLPNALPVWNEIHELAKRAQQINLNSGELIQLKLRHNQQALSVLNNAVNKANLYGPDGQPSFAPGSGKPIASA